jgi:hypothetical protein
MTIQVFVLGIWQTGPDQGSERVSSVLLVHAGDPFAVTFNWTGLEVWRTDNGTDWEHQSASGFGNRTNTASLVNNAILSFREGILIGTWNNFEGGALWMPER